MQHVLRLLLVLNMAVSAVGTCVFLFVAIATGFNVAYANDDGKGALFCAAFMLIGNGCLRMSFKLSVDSNHYAQRAGTAWSDVAIDERDFDHFITGVLAGAHRPLWNGRHKIIPTLSGLIGGIQYTVVAILLAATALYFVHLTTLKYSANVLNLAAIGGGVTGLVAGILFAPCYILWQPYLVTPRLPNDPLATWERVSGFALLQMFIAMWIPSVLFLMHQFAVWPFDHTK